MAKNLEPKCKQCRRLGEKLFLKGDRCETTKCGITKRNYPPGAQGPKSKYTKPSGYAIQLAEKQKAKKQYNILEKQFKLTFNKGKKLPGDSGENLLRILEMRFDNVIFRAGFAKSKPQARANANHYHYLINGNKVNIPSCQVKKGDIIELTPRSKKSKLYKTLQESLKKITAPGWLNVDSEKLSIKVLHNPTNEDLSVIKINTQIIVEFYSR
ncbi:30S ribosomal protein S4 [Patescibacteria group bacterium]|nr:30S ribosomal protein S4 [Patescibacteria group bacterium]